MKKIKMCVISGSRADYGHLYWLLRHMKTDRNITLQLVVTGMHLSKRYGQTYKVIEKDGFKISRKVDILNFEDNEQGVTKAVGLGCQKFADVFRQLKPDVVVLFGDRYEMLAAAIAAYFSKITIAHIHGGEITEGLIDEGIRHAITKMAYYHFTSTEVYRKRVIQLGEEPKRVFNVGAPGLDFVHHVKVMSKNELSKSLLLDLEQDTILVTFHPVTLDRNNPMDELRMMLKALKGFKDNIIFTKANADPYGTRINKALAQFCRGHAKRYRLFDSLGQERYYGCLKHCRMMMGNSSSGIIEAPSFCLPVVNIGDRQKSRLKAKNVIDVRNSASDIRRGMAKALSRTFARSLKGMRNPYDRYADGETSVRIIRILKGMKLNQSIQKKFYDLKVS